MLVMPAKWTCRQMGGEHAAWSTCCSTVSLQHSGADVVHATGLYYLGTQMAAPSSGTGRAASLTSESHPRVVVDFVYN